MISQRAIFALWFSMRIDVKVNDFVEDEPSKSKKQKVLNILVFASFTMHMLDMALATLANTVIRIGTPISGLVEMRILPGPCVTSRDSAVPVTS